MSCGEIEQIPLGFLSPDAILTEMAKLLERPQFRELVKQKYRAVIIDEFQDTDPVQWAIFRTLFLNVKQLYIVGDPKQSIYAFRNADLYTYLEAKENFSVAHLDTNFRSAPKLIDALNTLFSTKEWMYLPKLQKFLDVHRVQAGVKEDGEGLLHFFVSQEKDEERLFAFIAQNIVPHLSNAVLVKDRFQGARLQAYLRKWNISCAVKRAGSLADTLAFSAMHDLLEAVKRPDDASAVKKVLAGPFICFNHHNCSYDYNKS